MRTRPPRFRLCGEDGRRLTLLEGVEAFIRLDSASSDTGPHSDFDMGAHAAAALVLGLGPDAGSALAPLLQNCRDVLWLECPAFTAGMTEQHPDWDTHIPAAWRALSLQNHAPRATPQHTLPKHTAWAELAASVVRGRRVFWHTQNLRLFPSFWGPVLGAVQAALLQLPVVSPAGSSRLYLGPAQNPRTVFLPGGEQELLHRELTMAFASEGFVVCSPCSDRPSALKAGQKDSPNPAQSLHAQLRAHLHQERPALFFSVNGRGLDAHGVNFALLRACGVPVVLWFVDTPWHILSAWQQPWWRAAHLFVTDASFIPDLKKAGADRVHHLPLAAAQHMLAAHEGRPSTLVADSAAAWIHFVGRASFPARDKFFAAARVPETLMRQAQALLDISCPSPLPTMRTEEIAHHPARPSLPDFHWWAQHMDVPLWPGHAVRAVGLGAERCAVLRRTRWLEAALSAGLAIHGDEQGWRALLPKAPAQIFHPAVDYYDELPALYAQSRYSLNVTSLLLPAGLTQRHFDVWAAGGFLLSDATSGLDIFPRELTQDIRLQAPQALPIAVDRLERDPALRRHLQEAWQKHLRAAHTYVHRVRTVLELCNSISK